jgi:ADP-heptose:LPS heptosyltransferase
MLADHEILLWYPPPLKPGSRSGIGVYVGASEINKRWDPKRWAAAIRELALAYPSELFTVLTGRSNSERSEAAFIKRKLNAHRNIIVETETSLEDNLVRLSRFRLLLSHDSYPIHLASLLHIPIMGVYISTDPVIWGSYDNAFTYVWSAIDCGGRKRGTGNCVHFHTTCPNLEEMRSAITVDQVIDASVSLFDRTIARGENPQSNRWPSD